MKDPISYEIAAVIGGFVGTLVGAALVASIYWAILVFLIHLPVSFLEVNSLLINIL